MVEEEEEIEALRLRILNMALLIAFVEILWPGPARMKGWAN